MNSLKIHGLILARSGSKGVPKKNIKELAGKPLIGYVIQEAKKVKQLDDLFVSSDSNDILNLAIELGANTIKRPPELATDDSPAIDSIQHFRSKFKCDYVVLLSACCPLTLAEDIENALNLVLRTGAKSVVSLVEDFSSHPSKLCTLKDGVVLPFGKFETINRQSLERVYKRNTAIYIAHKDLILQGRLFDEETRGYVMPKERSWDINDMWDWAITEYLIKKQI